MSSLPGQFTISNVLPVLHLAFLQDDREGKLDAGRSNYNNDISQQEFPSKLQWLQYAQQSRHHDIAVHDSTNSVWEKTRSDW